MWRENSKKRFAFTTRKVSFRVLSCFFAKCWNYEFIGQGFISTKILKQILHEIDENLSETELDGIIEEVDEDGSGTVDFDGNFEYKPDTVLF